MSTEAKVGAFTLAGLALLAGVIIMLSGFKLGGDKGYTLYAGFNQVVGVEPQSIVRLSGVPVGKVKKIQNDGQGVTVTLSINSDVKIPKSSQATIATKYILNTTTIILFICYCVKSYYINNWNDTYPYKSEILDI